MRVTISYNQRLNKFFSLLELCTLVLLLSWKKNYFCCKWLSHPSGLGFCSSEAVDESLAVGDSSCNQKANIEYRVNENDQLRIRTQINLRLRFFYNHFTASESGHWAHLVVSFAQRYCSLGEEQRCVTTTQVRAPKKIYVKQLPKYYTQCNSVDMYPALWLYYRHFNHERPELDEINKKRRLDCCW